MRTKESILSLTTLGVMAGLVLSAAGCREAPASEAPPRVEPAAAAPAIRVRAEAARRETFDRPVALTGMARANQMAVLTANVPGQVVSRNVEVGQPVAEDEVLLQLDGTHIRLDLRQAQANVAARRTDVRYAEQEAERATKLHEAGAQPGRVRDQAQYNAQKAQDGLQIALAAQARAHQALRDTRIRAPFAGVVADVQVHEGDTLAPGRPAVALVDLSQVRVSVGLTAADAAALEPGQEATVTFDALGGLELTGRLHSVGPSPDRASGNYPAELIVDNPDGRIREGMVARVHLPAQPREALLIPSEAVLRVGGSPAVFVVEGRGTEARVRRQPVRLGASSDGRVEVLEGLDQDDRVVTEGLFALSDGARVQVEGE